MRIHAIIHASFERLGAIETWANDHKHELTFTHTYAGEQLPAITAFDLLVVMGAAARRVPWSWINTLICGMKWL